jgi:hypothetical protein
MKKSETTKFFAVEQRSGFRPGAAKLRSTEPVKFEKKQLPEAHEPT